MNLNELAKLVNKKREELDELVRKSTLEISLQEIASEIVFHPEYFPDKIKYGKELNFFLKSEEYTISIDELRLVLRDIYGTKIKIFRTPEVKKVYDELFAYVQNENKIL